MYLDQPPHPLALLTRLSLLQEDKSPDETTALRDLGAAAPRLEVLSCYRGFGYSHGYNTGAPCGDSFPPAPGQPSSSSGWGPGMEQAITSALHRHQRSSRIYQGLQGRARTRRPIFCTVRVRDYKRFTPSPNRQSVAHT